MSKDGGFPSLTTVRRHAKRGVQDDTYLVSSPFLTRKVSNATAAKAVKAASGPDRSANGSLGRGARSERGVGVQSSS